MIQASLQVDDVELSKIQIPQVPGDIKYGQYLDIAMFSTDINNWLVKQIEDNRNYGNQYRIKLAKATAKIYGVKYEHLLKLKYDGIDFLEKLYSITLSVVGQYIPKDNGGKFEHNGKEYEIPIITQAIFRGTNVLPDMSFQQLTEISESERLLDDAIKKIDAEQLDEKDIKGTIITKAERKASITFNNTMKKIVLCLHETKDIPTDSSFDRWIESKMIELREISMPNALDTIFFLNGIPNSSEILIALGSILNNLESLDTVMKPGSNMQNEFLKSTTEQSAYEI